jgi:hypothetical protein
MPISKSLSAFASFSRRPTFLSASPPKPYERLSMSRSYKHIAPIAELEADPTLELLISDKNCPSQDLLFRRKPQCAWLRLSRMQKVH